MEQTGISTFKIEGNVYFRKYICLSRINQQGTVLCNITPCWLLYRITVISFLKRHHFSAIPLTAEMTQHNGSVFDTRNIQENTVVYNQERKQGEPNQTTLVHLWQCILLLKCNMEQIHYCFGLKLMQILYVGHTI